MAGKIISTEELFWEKPVQPSIISTEELFGTKQKNIISSEELFGGKSPVEQYRKFGLPPTGEITPSAIPPTEQPLTDITTEEYLKLNPRERAERNMQRVREARTGATTPATPQRGATRSFEQTEPLGLRLVKGFGRGVSSMITGTGGALKWVGAESVGKPIAEYGKEAEKFYEVKDPKFVDQLAGGVGSLSTFFIPGLGIAKGVQALTFAPRLAAWFGVAASSVMEAIVEAGGKYEESLARKRTVKEAQVAANKTFWANLPILLITNKLGLFREKGGMLAKTFASSLSEGSQEATQEVIGNIALNDPKLQNVPTAFGVGAITGGGMGLVISGLETVDDRIALKKAQQITRAVKEKPVTPTAPVIPTPVTPEAPITPVPAVPAPVIAPVIARPPIQAPAPVIPAPQVPITPTIPARVPEVPVVAPISPKTGIVPQIDPEKNILIQAFRKLDVAQNNITAAIKKHGFGGILKSEQHPELLKAEENKKIVDNEVYNELNPERPIGTVVFRNGENWTLKTAYFNTGQSRDSLIKGSPTGRNYRPSLKIYNNSGENWELSIQEFNQLPIVKTGVAPKPAITPTTMPIPAPISPKTGIIPQKGYVTVYHRTDVSIDEILRSGFKSKEYPKNVFVSNREFGQVEGYGKNVIKFQVKKSDLELSDEFPNGEKHYEIPENIATKYLRATEPKPAITPAEGVKPPVSAVKEPFIRTYTRKELDRLPGLSGALQNKKVGDIVSDLMGNSGKIIAINKKGDVTFEKQVKTPVEAVKPIPPEFGKGLKIQKELLGEEYVPLAKKPKPITEGQESLPFGAKPKFEMPKKVKEYKEPDFLDIVRREVGHVKLYKRDPETGKIPLLEEIREAFPLNMIRSAESGIGQTLDEIAQHLYDRGFIDEPTEGAVLAGMENAKRQRREPQEYTTHEPLTNEKIADIMRSSKSMMEARNKIKAELDMDFSIADLKEYEPMFKGGLPPDMSNGIIKDLSSKINTKISGATMDYGVDEIFNISTPEIMDSITTFEKVKQWTGERIKDAKESLHNLEMAQNYLTAYPDSKPIAEGVIDNSMKMTRLLTDLRTLEIAIDKAPNKQAIADILVNADRSERTGADKIENVISTVNKLIEQGKLTQKDKDAIVAFGQVRKVIKNQIIDEILNSRLGVRIKSEGIKYQVKYTIKSGVESTRDWVSEYTYENLKKKYPDIQILDQKERIIIKHRDPNTGEYVIRKELVDDYDEAVAIMGEEQKNLIREVLPYFNWIPHNRIEGKVWIEVYEPLAGGGEQKVFSARVPNDMIARKMGVEIKAKMPSAKIAIKPHNDKMKYVPSFGSMVEVQLFLNQAGIEPTSEAGQRIINAYRSMSGLMSSLIHAQNVAGYRVDYDGIVEGLILKAKQAIYRGYRQDIKELYPDPEVIKDDFRFNVAKKYIDALSSVTEKSPKLDGIKALTYFWILANKPTYITQNFTEMAWGLARLPKLNKPFVFWAPLSKEYTPLIDLAYKNGVLKPFFGEQMVGQGTINQLNVLGNASETWSSKKIFGLGLRIARDKGLVGQEAYRQAYQYMFVGKPLYNNANTLIGLLEKEAGWVNRYGFIFLRWSIDWINKFARGNTKTKLRTIFAVILMAGIGGLPFGRKLLSKFGIVNIKKNPRSLSITDRFLLAGIPGTLGVDPTFLNPVFYGYKGVGEIGEIGGSVLRGIKITSSQIQRANIDYKKYGIIGAIGHLPLAGAQYPILGFKKAAEGVEEVRGKRKKVIYRPITTREKILTGAGLTTFELGQLYKQKRKE